VKSRADSSPTLLNNHGKRFEEAFEEAQCPKTLDA